MGGVSFGSRSNTSINTMNPASYSAVDSMTFMFDIGSSALISRFSTPTGSRNTTNANLEYITMQFPLFKGVGFSAGLLPYSFVGYNFSTNDTTYLKTNNQNRDTVPYTNSFVGTGGFSQVYMGISAKVFNHFSIGINGYYLYGQINNYRDLSFSSSSGFTSTTEANMIRANNFRYRVGLQYFNTFSQKHDVTLGAIYEPKVKLNGGFSQITTGVQNDTIDANHANYTNYDFEMPTMYGFGVNYTYDKKLSIGIDYSMQAWKDSKYFGKTDSLNNLSKIAVGVEYQPNPRGRNYADRIRYRAGFNVSDSYYKLQGISQPKNYSLTAGIGLPLYNKSTNSISMLNASIEYGKIGSASTLQEDYFKINLNVVFNEHWFFKRKL